MKVDKQINNQNIKLFKRYGIKENLYGLIFSDSKNSEEKIYTCVCCRRKTSINDSGSIRGAYLVCGWCAYDKFDGWYGLRKWQCKMIREELEDD